MIQIVLSHGEIQIGIRVWVRLRSLSCCRSRSWWWRFREDKPRNVDLMLCLPTDWRQSVNVQECVRYLCCYPGDESVSYPM
jgi:hypothetical protein